MATSSRTQNNINEEVINQFIAVTGADRLVAVNLLEACAGNLDMAVGMHMDSGQAGPSSAGVGDAPTIVDQEEGVRAPIPQRTEVLVEEDSTVIANRLRRPKRHMRSVFDGFRDFQAEAYQFDGSAKGKSLSKKRNLEDLFRPPVDMTYKGAFQSARDFGSDKNRWLLVNVQNVQEFPCQLLNRDVWSHPEARSVVKDNFVFWQVYNDSEEGKRFMQFYKVNQWPYVAIIDPFTGESQVVWNKIPDGNVFLELARDFLSMCPVPDSSQAPTSAKRQKREPSIVDASEQEQLEAAIQASLCEDNKKKSNPKPEYVYDSDSEADVIEGSDLETFTDSDDDVIVSSPKSPTAPHTSAKLPTKLSESSGAQSKSSPSYSAAQTQRKSSKRTPSKNCSRKAAVESSHKSTSSNSSNQNKVSSAPSSSPFCSSSTSLHRLGRLSRTINGSDIHIVHEDIDSDADSNDSCRDLGDGEGETSTSGVSASTSNNHHHHHNHYHSSHDMNGGGGGGRSSALSPADFVVEDSDNNSLLDMLGTRNPEVSTPQFLSQDDDDENSGDAGEDVVQSDDWKQYWGPSEDPMSKIMLRFPDNNREPIELPCSSQIQALTVLCASRGYSSKDFELVTNFPRRKLSQMDPTQTLKDAGLFPQDTVFIQDL